jgi:predicted transcriptional regulator
LAPGAGRGVNIDAMTHPLIEQLTQARKAAQMTQADLAERAGLSRMTVQRLESGGLDPRLSTLSEMARVLGLEFRAHVRSDDSEVTG